MNFTSETRQPDYELEAIRTRLERLVQNAVHDYSLRFDFGETDQIGKGQLVLRMEPTVVRTARHPALVGRVLHLLGHYLNESMEWWEVARREENLAWPYFTALWHALEDARMENGMLQRWPGIRKFLDEKLPPNLGGALIRMMKTTQQVEFGLYLHGRGIEGAQWSPTVGEALEEVSEKIARGASGPSPRSSLEAMVEIYPVVAPLLRGEHVVSLGSPSKTSESVAAHREDGSDSPVERQSPEPEIETRDEIGTVEVVGHRQDFPEWFKPGSAPWFERDLGEKRVHPSAVRTDRETIIHPPPGDHEEYRMIQMEVQREAGFLVRRLTNILREDVYLRYGGTYRTGKLNMGKLWRQRLGIYRLFHRPVSGGDRPMAVSLLVDESASMKGQGKDKLARMTAILLGETLSQLDVPLEIIGFSTKEYEAKAAMRLGLTPAYQYRTMRCSSLEHRLYKRFDEPYPFVRSRLTDIQPRHNNWDEEHLLFACRRLQDRKEERKLMIVISDGQPNGDADYLIQTVQRIERRDCKLVGVGIGADFVKEIYPDAIVVDNFGQLAEELLQVLVQVFQAGPRLSNMKPSRSDSVAWQTMGGG